MLLGRPAAAVAAAAAATAVAVAAEAVSAAATAAAAATVERGSSEVVVANVVAVHDDDVDVGRRPVVDGRPAILEGIQEVWIEGLWAEF